jgi:hypothetical protein
MKKNYLKKKNITPKILTSFGQLGEKNDLQFPCRIDYYIIKTYNRILHVQRNPIEHFSSYISKGHISQCRSTVSAIRLSVITN